VDSEEPYPRGDFFFFGAGHAAKFSAVMIR
jgi:hypothetical protein